MERLEKANRLSKKRKLEHIEKKLKIGIEKLTPQDREIYEKEENRIRLQKLKEAKEAMETQGKRKETWKRRTRNDFENQRNDKKR